MDRHAALERSRLGRRLESEFDQLRAVLLECSQGLGVTAGAMQRQHQLTAESFAQRLGVDQAPQLGDHVVGESARQLCVDEMLGGVDPELVEPGRLSAYPLLSSELPVGTTLPASERLAERAGRLDRIMIAELPAPSSTSCSNRCASI